MVLHHVHSKVHELRQRTPQEREAIALVVAAGVVVVLFIAWLLLFSQRVTDEVPQMSEHATMISSSTVQLPSSGSNQNSDAPVPVSQLLVQTASNTPQSTMNDAEAQDTVNKLMQIANGQSTQQ